MCYDCDDCEVRSCFDTQLFEEGLAFLQGDCGGGLEAGELFECWVRD